jgi:hypothetical protein
MRKILYFIMIFIFIIGCYKNNPVNQSVNQNNNNNDNLENTIIESSGAMVINGRNLVECNLDTQGQLFYVIEFEQFRYCNNSSYVTINLRGDKGDKGDQGLQGLQGDKGDKGDQGLQGEKGDKGDKGDQGLQGVQGMQGVQGQAGLNGLNGTNGTPLKVYDSVMTEIKYAVSFTHLTITLISPQGYLYYLNWAGEMTQTPFSWITTDCTGTPYIDGSFTNRYTGFFLRQDSNGVLYKPANLDVNNMAIVTTINRSSHGAPGNCTSFSGTIEAIEMEPTTKAACGIPETITPPLSIQFQ